MVNRVFPAPFTTRAKNGKIRKDTPKITADASQPRFLKPHLLPLRLAGVPYRLRTKDRMANGKRQLFLWSRGGKWPSIIHYVYNMGREDGVGIIVLEAPRRLQLLSTVFFALPRITTMSQASYMTPCTASATFAVCICLVCSPPRSDPPHASPASKFMRSFTSQISSSVDGLRPWSSKKKPCQEP